MADPTYEIVLKLIAPKSGAEVLIDCGVVLRAIDTLLFLAPKEVRGDADWMFRLYQTRVELKNKAIQEQEAIGEDLLNGESGNIPEPPIVSAYKNGDEGEGSDIDNVEPDRKSSQYRPADFTGDY